MARVFRPTSPLAQLPLLDVEALLPRIEHPRWLMPHNALLAAHAHWLSRLRSTLRLLSILLSASVVVFLVHTLDIYRGNRYLDLRKGELPMTWPARTNLVPTMLLFSVAASSLIASLTIVALALRRSFRRPPRSRDLYRVLAGSMGVVMWIAAIACFSLLDSASKASLGRYSCSNANVMSNGRYQYRTVCEEQVLFSLLSCSKTTNKTREWLGTLPWLPQLPSC